MTTYPSTVLRGRELLLHPQQLSAGGYGITSAMLLILTANPSNGNTFRIKNASVDYTYTFLTSPSVAFDVEIGVDLPTTVYNLIGVVNGNSPSVVAVPADILEVDATNVIIALVDNGVDPGPSSSKCWSSTISADIVNYSNELDYSKSSRTPLPTSEPAISPFGLYRGGPALFSVEIHTERHSDYTWIWDKDAGIWVRDDGFNRDGSLSIAGLRNSSFITRKITQTATNYLLLATDHILEVTDTSAARTISFPSVEDLPEGLEYIVKDKSGGAVTNNITINPDGTETIDGASTATINTNYGFLKFYNNGTEWSKI